MYVTTFYSFKGGVGRSMALANVAASLALRGRRVLVVDFDIEAPGLDTFDVLNPGKEEIPGILDFVARYLETGQSPDVSEFIGECPAIGDQGGHLWIMPSGRNTTYAARFNRIDWGNLYRRHDGYLLFEDIKAQWKQHLNPDYVLIDSRTGHTDTSGICTRQLPNSVVILFFPNEQNLRGLVSVVNDIRTEAEGVRERKIDLHFVMSNVPDLDDEDRILENKIKDFQEQLRFRQEPMVVHRYDSLSLLNQAVFARDRPKSRLAKEYTRIVREITVRNSRDRDGALEYIRRAKRVYQLTDDGSMLRQEKMLDAIEKAHPEDGEVLFRLFVLKESYLDPRSASSMISKAIEVGYDTPEAYLKRSKIREEEDPDGATEDIRHVLDSEEISSFMVREAISRLWRLETYDHETVVNAPAVLSLDTDDRFWLADRFNHSKDGLQLAVSLLESVLHDGKPSKEELDETTSLLGMSYMGLGRCPEAVEMFLDEGTDLADAGIETAFNYAMAMWGATGTTEPELFERVVEFDDPDTWQERDPNYLQCMAIAFWSAGNTSKALESLEQALQAINRLDRAELSCWRYLKVNPDLFREDLAEIRSLIEGHSHQMPRFAVPAED